MAERDEFSAGTKQQALERQGYRCASCGTKIYAVGEAGQAKHKFGERAEAHHVQHAKYSGLGSLDNCVVICRACHYSVHGGGRFKENFGGVTSDYPHFKRRAR